MITTTTRTEQKPVKLSWAEKRALSEAGQAAPTEAVEITDVTASGVIQSMVQDGHRFTYIIDGDTITTTRPLYVSGTITLQDGTEVASDMIIAAEGDTVTVPVEARDGSYAAI